MKTRSLYGKSGSNNNNSNNNNNDNDNSSDDNSNGSYGNAILSRYPITKSWTLSYTQWRWRPPRKCLFVEVDIVDNVDSVDSVDRRCDRRRLCFGSTHLQNDMAGLESGEQLVEVRRERRERREKREKRHSSVCCAAVLCCCVLLLTSKRRFLPLLLPSPLPSPFLSFLAVQQLAPAPHHCRSRREHAGIPLCAGKQPI